MIKKMLKSLNLFKGSKASCQFVIWAPSYDDNSGGSIVLHALVHRLNRLGYSARLWPAYTDRLPSVTRWLLWSHALWLVRKLRGFKCGPFPNRLARYRDLKHAVIIYPEVIIGNPAHSDRVVRWLLYYPGRHNGVIDFGTNDLVVPFSREFAREVDTKTDFDLFITHHNELYSQINFGARSGSCFLIHKGNSRNLDKHPPNAIPIDKLPHSQIADIFNKCEFLYSYDLYSHYSIYAAVCGCTPIIIPEEGIIKETWYEDERRRLGIAYGEDEIDWAIATRPYLLNEIRNEQEIQNQTIRRFAEFCLTHFWSADNIPIRTAVCPSKL